MKKLFTALTLAATLFVSSAFAGEIKANPEVLKSFEGAFGKQASEVSWSVSENLYKAHFALNGQYATAFYTPEGTLLAVSRNITSLQLPLPLQTTLKKDFSEYWISDLFEISNDSGIEYYVTLENADARIVLKASGGLNWSTFQKARKS
ncbi:MAG TPA: hypothetical protein VHK69_14710 [Chitinophagaceae bacterium]|jgi:hypothetical protein|nr:hypothetical protein [Chitinophagaceae bacterium]